MSHQTRQTTHYFDHHFAPHRTTNLHLHQLIIPFILLSLFTLRFDGFPIRLLLTITSVLAITEVIALNTCAHSAIDPQPIGGAIICLFTFTSLTALWYIPNSLLLLFLTLTFGIRVISRIVDQFYPNQPWPHPCPNLLLDKTFLGLLTEIILPVLVVNIAIALGSLNTHYRFFSVFGLTTALTDFLIPLFERACDFHYSNDAAALTNEPSSYLSRLLNHISGDSRGLLDRISPLIISGTLLALKITF